jgi:hypothetical protein
VLIDAETTPVAATPALFDTLAAHGTVRVCRAYADWTAADLRPWFSTLRRHGIQPVHHFAARQHRRAMVALCLDALDLAQGSPLDTVVVVGDLGHVLPLVVRLHTAGLSVVGVGPASTPHDLRAACDAFIDLAVLHMGDSTGGGRHRA